MERGGLIGEGGLLERGLIGEGGLLERGAYWRGGLIYSSKKPAMEIISLNCKKLKIITQYIYKKLYYIIYIYIYIYIW